MIPGLLMLIKTYYANLCQYGSTSNIPDFSSQDVGLAALQSANNSVAEARSAMNQRMQCANECP